MCKKKEKAAEESSATSCLNEMKTKWHVSLKWVRFEISQPNQKNKTKHKNRNKKNTQNSVELI